MNGTNASKPRRWLQGCLFLAMVLILLTGLTAAARLAAYLDQPVPGVALFWRKEYKLLTVGWMTPPHWSGIQAGLKVNDRIICIDGYMPSPDSPVYGLDPRYAQSPCPNGKKNFAEIYRQVYGSPEPALSFFIDRDGTLMTVPDVPLVPFTLSMLIDCWLALFLIGVGLLAVGIVALLAAPTNISNLLFAALACITASFVMQQEFIPVFSDLFRESRLVTLAMMVPWVPFVGVVATHLTDRLTCPSPFSKVTAALLKPFYALSCIFAVLGIVIYILNNVPLLYPLVIWYNLYVVASLAAGFAWSLLALSWGWRRGSTRRIRARSNLVFLCLAYIAVLLAPYIVMMFNTGLSFRYLQNLTYLGLGAIAFISYGILRYQVYAIKGRVLTGLLLLSLCALTAHLASLISGQADTFLPIFLGVLLTGIIMQARWGPFSTLNRFLHRERLDYQTVSHFSHDVMGVVEIPDLVRALATTFQHELDVEQMKCWLQGNKDKEWQYFENGELHPPPNVNGTNALDLWFETQPVKKSPGPLPDPLLSILEDKSTNSARDLWVPLTNHKRPVGLLKLGARWTGEAWGDDDLRLVSILSQQFTLSVLNAYQIERLHSMQQNILQAEENERSKIARELHDTVLQFLLVLNYGLDGLKYQTTVKADEIERWQDRISIEAGQLRDLVGYLRSPEILVQRGLVASLQSLVDQTRLETEIPILVDLDSRASELLPLDRQIAVYRVIREALHNAMKYANARSIRVSLLQMGDSVRFEIADDGAGFILTEKLQTGERYRSLRDLFIYIESAGGHLDIKTAPGSGTIIQGYFQIPPGTHK